MKKFIFIVIASVLMIAGAGVGYASSVQNDSDVEKVRVIKKRCTRCNGKGYMVIKKSCYCSNGCSRCDYKGYTEEHVTCSTCDGDGYIEMED